MPYTEEERQARISLQPCELLLSWEISAGLRAPGLGPALPSLNHLCPTPSLTARSTEVTLIIFSMSKTTQIKPSLCNFPGAWRTAPLSSYVLPPLPSCSDSFRITVFLSPKVQFLLQEAQSFWNPLETWYCSAILH